MALNQFIIMALNPNQMSEAIIRNLKEKTGKTLEEWLDEVKETALEEKKEVIEFLKNEKGLGHFQAQEVYKHFKDN